MMDEIYRNLFNDCEQLFEKYSNPTDDNGFWHSLCADAETIYRKYYAATFAREMVFAVMDEIQRIEAR